MSKKSKAKRLLKLFYNIELQLKRRCRFGGMKTLIMEIDNSESCRHDCKERQR